jgi:hypothetical protein
MFSNKQTSLSIQGGGRGTLAMVDDLVCISECGIKSVLMNAFINAKTNAKKLQFGVSKCHKMQIGQKRSFCPSLKIDNWDI